MSKRNEEISSIPQAGREIIAPKVSHITRYFRLFSEKTKLHRLHIICTTALAAYT
jgi:hypothetical protein